MRILLAIFLLLASPAFGLEWEKAEFGFSMAIPHNEPVIHNTLNSPYKIARYVGDVSLGIKAWRLHMGIDYRAWFKNGWQDGASMGHGWETWGNMDYGTQGVSHEVKLLGAIDVWRGLQMTTEYRESRQMFGKYYWLVGVRWKLR